MSNTMTVAKSTSPIHPTTPTKPLTPTHLTLNRVVTDLGAKARVMELMTHTDADVRYRALLSVQRLVSTPWVS